MSSAKCVIVVIGLMKINYYLLLTIIIMLYSGTVTVTITAAIITIIAEPGFSITTAIVTAIAKRSGSCFAGFPDCCCCY